MKKIQVSEHLRSVRNQIIQQAKMSSLNVVDNGWIETLEIRLQNSDYAFGSVQICGGNKKPQYIELRFKRVHLRSRGLFELINEINPFPFRQDVKRKDGKEPESIRYHFYEASPESNELINKIFRVVSQ